MGGTTWTLRTSPQINEWYDVAHGNGTFAAVGFTGSNRVMTSTSGLTWTARTASHNNLWTGITYGGGQFVAVSYDGTGDQVMTSPDGTTWTQRVTPSGAANQWWDVTYGNGLYVAVAGSGTGNRVMTSPDGINWTARTSAEDNDWYGVTYGNGLFVACAITGTNRIMTSPDGITWTARSIASQAWWDVTYGVGTDNIGKFVAVSNSGTNRVATSTDGITWTLRTTPASISYNGVTFGNRLFCAIANSGTGNRVMTSPDGITWTSQTSAGDKTWTSVAYGNGMLVAVSDDLTNSSQIMSSPNNDSFLTVTTGDVAVRFGNNRLAVTLAAVTADFDGRQANAVFADTAAVVSSVEAYAGPHVIAYGNATSSLTSDQITQLIDVIHATAPLTSSVMAVTSALSSANITDLLQVLFDLNLSTTGAGTAAFGVDAVHIEHMLEAIEASGMVDSRLQAIGLLSTALVASDSVQLSFPVEFSTSAAAVSALASKLIATAEMVTAAAVVETLTGTTTAVITVTDTSQVLSTLSSTATLIDFLQSNGTAEIMLYASGVPTTGWVVNADSGAASEYKDFSFDSMCRLGQKYYGVNEDGIYRLGGDDDDGDPIAARILTGELDFGSPQLKRVQDMYLGYTGTGDLVLKTVATVNGRRVQNWYQAQTPEGVDRPGRVKLGRGVESRYWQFELVNESGADFELDRMDLSLIHLSRRV